MTSSAGCILVLQAMPWPSIKYKKILKKHLPYDWALPGTLENLVRVNKYLKERQQQGYLFGGCLKKRLPRKDIDVFLEYNLEDANHGYKALGVDWWFKDYAEGGAVGKNVNGIVTRLSYRTQDYEFKESGGLLLPKEYLQENPRSQLTRILYSKDLKGGGK